MTEHARRADGAGDATARPPTTGSTNEQTEQTEQT